MARETTTPVTFRASAELLEWLDRRASAKGVTRAEAAKQIIEAMAIPTVKAAADIPSATRYARPAHDVTCKCGMCRGGR